MMNNVDDILDYAIEQEQIAADFYLATVNIVNSAEMRQIMQEFADEELRHKDILINVKAGDHALTPEQEVLDLKVSDYLVDMTVSDNLTYQDALIIAMKREKAAYQLYADMAGQLPAGELRSVLEGLAVEESKHKLYFELQYDDHVMMHN